MSRTRNQRRADTRRRTALMLTAALAMSFAARIFIIFV